MVKSDIGGTRKVRFAYIIVLCQHCFGSLFSCVANIHVSCLYACLPCAFPPTPEAVGMPPLFLCLNSQHASASTQLSKSDQRHFLCVFSLSSATKTCYPSSRCHRYLLLSYQLYLTWIIVDALNSHYIVNALLLFLLSPPTVPHCMLPFQHRPVIPFLQVEIHVGSQLLMNDTETPDGYSYFILSSNLNSALLAYHCCSFLCAYAQCARLLEVLCSLPTLF